MLGLWLEVFLTTVGSFMRLWALFALLTLGYALLDYSLSPSLRFEGGFTMEPDLSRLPELLHWGGRLYINGAWLLLASNVLLLSGILALLTSGLLAQLKRWQRGTDEPAASVPARSSQGPSF